MAEILLKASCISKSFDTQILDNLSIDIAEGETHVIMGRSGQGKSTLLKILSGLLAADEGEVKFSGELLDNPDEVLVAGHEELAYVAQNFNLLHNRTVLENLKDALLAFKDEFAEHQIKQLMQLMRLEKLSSHKIESLSGGEKQRLAIARALATQPAVLLLDEPFTQLDYSTRQTLMDAIKEVRTELETSIILVSHNLFEAFYLADQIHVLDNGKIIKSDSPHSLYQNPELKAVAELLSDFVLLPSKSITNKQKRQLGIWAENVVVLEGEPSEYKFSISAKLKDCVFMGYHYRCVFVSEQGQNIIVKTNNKLESGSSFQLAFPDEYLFELKDE
ncbi:ABC transporter ATP-binding protein [Marivirga arenosa]|uniref:ABC transporter ATP-binding protein n=1 Tax=Marivirga arenosa TaxID=3059076 RepID=A0AA51N6D4_9BACT|nr:ABC transporter ATP-binding protein [Marivirga sp. ABR2-2]WMN06977.1 ABC transporter ATP-binding protein [Marivirga sp. ABR2-2]